MKSVMEFLYRLFRMPFKAVRAVNFPAYPNVDLGFSRIWASRMFSGRNSAMDVFWPIRTRKLRRPYSRLRV